MNIEDFDAKTQAQIKKKLDDRAAIRSAKQKQDRQAALDKAPGVPQLHAPCYFRCTTFKHGRNWDTNNLETKAILDGLVSGGIIASDRVEEIPDEFKRGVPITKNEEERTIVELIEL